MRRRRRRARPVTRAETIRSLGQLPPATGPVSDVHAALEAGLARVGAPLPVEPRWPVAERDVDEMPYVARLGAYHLAGDPEVDLTTFRAAWRFPGLLVLHEVGLDELIRALPAADPAVAWASRREISEARAALRGERLDLIPSASPSVVPIVRRARGIVVFAEAVRAYLRQLGCLTPVTVAAPPVLEDGDRVRAAAGRADQIRGQLGARRLVVAPTDRAESTNLAPVLAAAASLDTDVHLALVGRDDPSRDTAGLRAAAGLGERLHVHHHLSLDDLLAWFAAADAIVDLRRPHHVDVASGILRALASGSPLVAASDAWTPGLPGSAAIDVPASPEPAALAGTLGALIDDVGRGAALGAAAAAFVDAQRRTDASAAAYAAALTAALAVVSDPAGPALSRWAGAVADLGATEGHLEAGYFLSYVEALASFGGSSHGRDEDAAEPLLDSP